MKRLIFCIVIVSMVAGVGPAVQAKDQKAKVPEQAFPRRIFGKVDAKCVKDPKNDQNFYNGQPVGRKDKDVDILAACAAEVVPTAAVAERVEAALPCGASAKSVVVCSPTRPVVLENVPYVVLSVLLVGPAVLASPPEETARVLAHVKAEGGHEIEASAGAPNLAAAGANFTVGAVFNDPAKSGQSVDLLVIDERTGQFLTDSGARIWIAGRWIRILIPKSETREVISASGATVRSSRTATGDASQGNQDYTRFIEFPEPPPSTPPSAA